MNVFVLFVLIGLIAASQAIKFETKSKSGNGFKNLVHKKTFFVPYGPDLLADPPQKASGTVWEGYGYGMGAAEHIAYDPIQGYVYTQSQIPESKTAYISVIDLHSLADPKVTKLGLDLSSYKSEAKDLHICPEHGWLFVTLPDANKVVMLDMVERQSPRAPAVLKEIDAGHSPEDIQGNFDCTVLAVANANDGIREGGVHLISNLTELNPVIRPVCFLLMNDIYSI